MQEKEVRAGLGEHSDTMVQTDTQKDIFIPGRTEEQGINAALTGRHDGGLSYGHPAGHWQVNQQMPMVLFIHFVKKGPQLLF